jgi:hypothetical protein
MLFVEALGRLDDEVAFLSRDAWRVRAPVLSPKSFKMPTHPAKNECKRLDPKFIVGIRSTNIESRPSHRQDIKYPVPCLTD